MIIEAVSSSDPMWSTRPGRSRNRMPPAAMSVITLGTRRASLLRVAIRYSSSPAMAAREMLRTNARVADMIASWTISPW